MTAAHAIRAIDFAGLPAIELVDHCRATRAVVVPALSLLTTSLTVSGRELLYCAPDAQEQAAQRKLHGIPLLHPWANRLTAHRFTFAGRTVDLDPRDPNLCHDSNGLPIHGLLVAPHTWRIEDLRADTNEARLSASLDFGAAPALLRAFPFPHRIGITITLSAGLLRFATTIESPSDTDGVPVAFGFHPYFSLPGVAREHWNVEIPPSIRLDLDSRQLPTGSGTPFASPLEPLGNRTFDDAFVGLQDGSRFVVQGGDTRIEVVLESGYPCAQVYAPAQRDIICFEPMTAPTAALSSGHGLAAVAAGSSYSAVWSVRATTSV